jgi:hypothetical protein
MKIAIMTLLLVFDRNGHRKVQFGLDVDAGQWRELRAGLRSIPPARCLVQRASEGLKIDPWSAKLRSSLSAPNQY